jgi:hypothetical protein
VNGLDISERYFWSHGIALIESEFAEYRDRIAAGLVGDGSECYRFDDELSRDHDWGPGFCLWLNQQDYRGIGATLQKKLADLPTAFEDVGPRNTSEWGGGRLGVFEIGAFYRRFIGLDHVPANLGEWRAIPESNLAAATNGKVFTDPLGEFSRFRDALASFYPEDIRLKKIAARCMSIAQSGQYNYSRCIQRNEAVAAQQAEAIFASQTISLVFLLNRQYAPFYKWMHRAMKELPILGEVTHHLLSDLVTSYGSAEKTRVIEEICANLVDALRREGLSDSPSDFLLDHGPIVQGKIQNEDLRKVYVWLD